MNFFKLALDLKQWFHERAIERRLMWEDREARLAATRKVTATYFDTGYRDRSVGGMMQDWEKYYVERLKELAELRPRSYR
jgi:hypothetical protein